jgi:uncharacterized protein (DUF302 family)
MKAKILTLSLLLTTTGLHAAQGVISVESQHSVKETADKFQSIIKAKGLTLFSVIDHKKNAASVGLDLAASKVIIFGNPKIGTPLMKCAPSVAIDLPQKFLISQDAQEKVWISYNDPQYLNTRHDVQGCDKLITKVSNVLKVLSKAAAN